jgi:uncharacterized protein (UPF0548 family)
VVDEDGPVSRYGFAYGTLADHGESGEERFTVEWNRSSDKVFYDILAFSPASAVSQTGISDSPDASKAILRRFEVGDA